MRGWRKDKFKGVPVAKKFESVPNNKPLPICNYLAPRQEETFGIETNVHLAQCILPSHPDYPVHVVKTLEGKYVAWEYEENCRCCEPDDPDRCYDHWEVDESVYKKLKAQYSPSRTESR